MTVMMTIASMTMSTTTVMMLSIMMRMLTLDIGLLEQLKHYNIIFIKLVRRRSLWKFYFLPIVMKAFEIMGTLQKTALFKTRKNLPSNGIN